jgi:hypothetical protein
MGKSPAGVDIFGQCEYNNDEKLKKEFFGAGCCG